MMKLFNTLRPISSLTALLEQERTALLSGDFKTLAQLSTSKERLLKLVAQSQPSQADLNTLQRLSARNGKLLASSARGFKSARERLSQARIKPPQFKTYGPSGGMTAVGHKSLTIKTKY